MKGWLLAFGVLVGCYAGPQSPPPQAYGQQPGWRGSDGEWFCTSMQSRATRGSQCFATGERCEDERRRAQSDGVQAWPCRPQSPVSCFQLTDDPSPSMEMCAASAEDCDLLRLIDRDKNGRTGAVCEWRHGAGLPN